jgi:hypothetical protein
MMANLHWADFYLICFLVGFALTMFSLLVGVFKIDFPGKWDNLLHGGHALGHFHGGHGFGHHGAGHGHGPADGHVGHFNFSTIMAFLAMFGGTGYLLTTQSKFAAGMALAFAFGAGLVGAAIVSWYLTKMLVDYDRSMRPEDFDLVGTIGNITVSTSHAGTGELVYEQNGARKSVPIRSDDENVLARGDEVVITRFDRGIAYGKKFEEFVSGEAQVKTAPQEER